MSYKLEIFTDGACSGNPGPAGVGVVIKHNGATIKEISRPIGQATNNIAEYTALIYALQEALVLKADEVVVRSDSELMCHQVGGVYKVKHQNIKPLFERVRHLSAGFKHFRLEHVGREKNAAADQLSRRAIKKPPMASARGTDHICNSTAGQDGRPVAAGSGEESPSSKG